MSIFQSVPQTLTKHRNEAEAFQFRVKLIRKLIEVSKRKAEWHILSSQLLEGLNPERAQLDYQVSERLYEFITTNVPYRRDIVDVETIQLPEITVNLGGDCDDYVVLAGTLLESAGVQVQIAVSQQMGDGSYDHIFLYLPSIQVVFDPTAYPQQFPGITANYNNMKVVE